MPFQRALPRPITVFVAEVWGGWRVGVALGAVALFLVSACHLPVKSATPVPEPALVSDERAPLEWARGEDWFVLVKRTCRTVSVYRRGARVRTYHHVSFGRNAGDKLYEGDRKTPLGRYRMAGRRRHPRWSRFILLDYPNVRDLEVHRAAAAKGLVTNGPGSQIGIHGSDEPILNEGGVDWTYGCISLLDADVRDIYSTVPRGTLVLIED